MEQEGPKEAPVTKKDRSVFSEIFQSVAIAVLLAVVIRLFILEPFFIPSGSMEPTLKENDRILVSKLNYYFEEPERGDVVVFKYPRDTSRNFVKRVVAVGGETLTIRNSDLYIDGNAVPEIYLPPGLKFDDYGPVEVPEESYFVMGDNRNNSDDSRVWGFLPEDLIIGKAITIYWPPGRAGIVH